MGSGFVVNVSVSSPILGTFLSIHPRRIRNKTSKEGGSSFYMGNVGASRKSHNDKVDHSDSNPVSW